MPALRAQHDWTEIPAFHGVSGEAMVWDSARERMVYFGSLGLSGLTESTTWEWDTVAWVPRPSLRTPPTRTLSAMVFDPVRRVAVLFGGTDGVGFLSDTWEWDGSEWVRRNPATHPPARASHAVAFDAARQRIVLFGGENDQGLLGDTWEWDGTNWTSHTATPAPTARKDFALAYDPQRSRTLLFGGEGASGPLGDTWAWDGAAWVPQAPASSPLPQSHHVMVYDEAQQRVVLVTSTGLFFADTWEWDGVNWTQRFPQTKPSPFRSAQSMIYHGDLGTMLIVPVSYWYYLWDGTDWTRFSLDEAPRARGSAAMAYDRDRQRAILFGGRRANREQIDTWEWDGVRWANRTILPPRPGGRYGHGLAYDAARRRTVLFGGFAFGLETYQDTWLWDGTTWTEQLGEPKPSRRTNFGFAYDDRRQRVVLFGGAESTDPKGETWEWDGTRWTQRFPGTSPSPRAFTAMSYHQASGRVVMFGGLDRLPPVGTLFRETWEWDGIEWARRAPRTQPPARTSHAMARDDARGVVVLYGGRSASGVLLDDTWEWDGTDWHLAPRAVTAPEPVAMFQPAMTYDASRQRTLMFGGAVALGQDSNKLWTFGTPARVTPYGAACPGTNGPPELRASGSGRLPNPGFALEVDHALPRAATTVLLGVTSASLPLGGGCTLLLDPATPWVAVPTATNHAGFARTSLPLPALLPLRGQSFFAQAVALDPSGAFAASLALTGGLQIRLGD
ncbi:MAG: kelch repeat-containing protein [Planctomycetota bacterium]